MTGIRRLLVANRGEIACRIIRTARLMGIETVVVFSDPDAGAMFVQQADLAVHLPGSTATDTYLRADLIVAAALRTGADAIHPGYGFLSENADFAAAVLAAGLIFVGPGVEAIAAMGSKVGAKAMMAAAGVPVLPGVTWVGDPPADLDQQAAEVGYPLLVKASAGGGGRGMRVVDTPDALADAVAGAAREAGSAFGDGTVFLEKYVTAPRHVEVQIFGDSHGRVIHLFERECSIQRRFQKIIEESPSPAVSPELRESLGAAAVAAGQALGYTGAGTVEFIVAPDGGFYFLEVNTRLQVEHPVTEIVTGLDLVRLQLLVAQGEPLPEEALTATITGHAIEVRLYAEDPANTFLPTSGLLRRFELDDAVRCDSGFATGDTVGIHYDPMLAKMISAAPTRAEAASALAQALRRSSIHGPRTNRDLLVGILGESEFLSGGTDTAYLDRHSVADLVPVITQSAQDAAAVAALVALRGRRRAAATVQRTVTAGFRNVRSAPQLVQLADTEGVAHDVRYAFTDDRFELTVDGRVCGGTSRIAAVGVGTACVTLEIDSLQRRFDVTIVGDRIDVDWASGATEFRLIDLLPPPGTTQALGSLAAPMPGTVLRLEIEVGATVELGQPLLVLEAMKMEHTVRSPAAGLVEGLLVAAGEQVDVGQILAVVTEQSGPAVMAADPAETTGTSG